MDSSVNRNRADRVHTLVFSRLFLSFYDYSVLAFSNRVLWRCPTRTILAFYNAHVAAHHLDVGVGTGYYLDRCTFPTAHPTITLLDTSPDSLAVTAQRIARYRPTPCQATVFAPIPLPPQAVDSVGINYVLHCLPGTMADKGVVFDHLAPLVRPGGVIFGSTILGQGVAHHPLAQRVLRFYNAKQIFSNTADSLPALDAILRARFATVTLHQVGAVAFFAATV